MILIKGELLDGMMKVWEKERLDTGWEGMKQQYAIEHV